MHENERVIRDLYAARSRRDWLTVHALLADEVGWHEPGEEDHSGSFRGRDEVVSLLQKLVAVTEGTFDLSPEDFLNLDGYSAVLVHWSAERKGQRSEGRELAVYRLSDEKVGEVWFYNEPTDLEAFSAVFAFD